MADSKYVLNVTTENFETQVLQASLQHPVLVDFWAPWCGPCQSLGPILEKLADEYQGAFTVAKINTDEEQALAGQFGIRSLPTVALLHNGQVVDHFMGLQPESAIREMLNRHVQAPSDADVEQAQTALDSGDIEQAVAVLRQKIEQDPDKPELKAELAGALLLAGELDEARRIIDALPVEVRDSDAAKTAQARLQFIDALADAPDSAGLQQRIADTPTDLEARYRLGARLLLDGQSEAALEQFLEIMKRDRGFEDDLGRKSLVAAFLLIDDAKLVTRYRQRMTSLLF
jgi:putative thioredoxin